MLNSKSKLWLWLPEEGKGRIADRFGFIEQARFPVSYALKNKRMCLSTVLQHARGVQEGQEKIESELLFFTSLPLPSILFSYRHSFCSFQRAKLFYRQCYAGLFSL
jgi:hypothetical protein